MIDIGCRRNYPHLVNCLEHLGCPPDKIDMVVLSTSTRPYRRGLSIPRARLIAAHRLAANKIMLRDDF